MISAVNSNELNEENEITIETSKVNVCGQNHVLVQNSVLN